METANFGTRPHIRRSLSKNSCLRARSSIRGHSDSDDSDKRLLAMGHVLRNVCRALLAARFYFVSERNWENKRLWPNQLFFSTFSLLKEKLCACTYIYIYIYIYIYLYIYQVAQKERMFFK